MLDPYAIKHKRHDPQMIDQLKSLAGGSLENRVEVVLNNSRRFTLSLDELAARLSLTVHELAPAMGKLADRIITFDDGKLVALPPRVERLKEEIVRVIAAFHREKPYRLGVSREEVRSRLHDNVDLAAYKEVLASLVSEGKIKDMGQRIALAEHQVVLTESQLSLKDELEQTFRQSGLMTPLPREVLEGKPPEAEEMLELLIEMGTLVRIDEKIIIHRDWIDTARDKVVEYLRSNEKMSVADCRSLLGITRKYIIPLLYHFDNTGVTLRVGDDRVLRREFK